MNIHILNSENLYSIKYLEFLERNFDISANRIVFKKTSAIEKNYSKELKDRIFYAKSNFHLFRELLPELRVSSKIFFHHLPHGPALLFWSLFPSLLAKTTWIIWGADLYLYKEAKKSFSNRFYEFLRKNIIKQIPCIAALIREDYDLAVKIYKSRAEYIQVMYPLPFDYLSFAGKRDSEQVQRSVKILIGNSGDPSNNHLDLITKLETVRNSNIKIYCPLSYGGNQLYIDSIVTKGKEAFGNKFIPILKMIPPNQYLDLIYDIDIVIMNHERQQGLGNIFPLLYFRKKVFLRSDTTSFRYLESLGCRIFDILSVNAFTESDLSVENCDLIVNQEIIEQLQSEKNCIRMWEQVLSQRKNSFENFL